ncbi:CYTOSINE DEAMINASE FAMILY MEMBER [Salix purpurea]|uniref:CYTOSINE DEAMINASE FAMILY MEMBER n=1 Tax=Salix purpurea TaxID=77065 RepID=A0A9Q0UAF6_SALPP|nr:CYTOSINE DEAMINASE FAMILY MEMBER [Salix purpurea]
MHNTYISSTLLSVGTKGSLSFSFNDYSNLLNERFEGNPFLLQSCSSSCDYSCCCCCASSSSFTTTTATTIHRVPINPGLFLGFRQSTIIQCPPSRRLVLGGRNRYYYRSPAYGLDHGCYAGSCSFKEKNGSERVGRRREGGFGGVRLRERRCFSGVDDLEAVISLLSEEMSEECLGDGERNWGLSKRVGMEKRGNYSGGAHNGRRRRNNVGRSSLESDRKCKFGLSIAELRKEEFTKKEGREDWEKKEEKKAVLEGENSRGKRGSSSLSSYYSLSSAGDFESDMEAQDEYVDCLRESSHGYKELRSGEGRLEGQVEEEFERHRDGTEWKGEVLEARTGTRRTGVEWGLRKKYEKKLAEIEATQSGREPSQMQSRTTRTTESDYKKLSSSHKQIDDEEEKSLAVNLEKGTRKQYSQMGDHVKEQSELRRNYREITNKQESSGRNVETTSQSPKRFSGRGENLVDVNLVWKGRDERYEEAGETAAENNITRTTHQLVDTSTLENVRNERVSNLQRQSEPRMEILEEDRALGPIYETNEQQFQMGRQTRRQVQSRTCLQQLSKVSEVHDSSSKNTSILQSETRMKKQEGHESVVSSSGTEAKEHKPHRNQKALQGAETRKGSGDVTNISLNVTSASLVHASDMKTVTNFGGTSGKRNVDQESELTSAVEPIRETKERADKIEENITQFKSRNEVRRPTYESRHNETTSQEAAFDSQASANMVFQVGTQQVNGREGNQRTSQAIMMPPPSQLLAQGTACVNPPSKNANQGISRGTSESGTSALYINSGRRTPDSQQETYGKNEKDEIYWEPSNLILTGDALGSAHRLEESSMQFVGEFVEKARHEVLASEIQKENTVSDTKLAYEAEKQRQKSSGQYDSKDLQFKRQDSRKSSGGSREKGPSDEMWHVTDPSIQESTETEAPAVSTETESGVVRRTGRSLWSVISNIVRLGWGSHAETPKSARRPGGKSSSNDSVTSEAWFSGHEPDENSDENVKRGRESMPKEAVSSHQLQPTHSFSQRQPEGYTSSPSIMFKSESTSKGISTPSDEENLGWSQDGNNFQVATSSMAAGESLPVLLPSTSTSDPIVEESPGTAKTNVSVSGSMERPDSEMSVEVSSSEGKGVESKQRRLQRNKQVVRDRFDEWEEANLRESELRKTDEMFMREALLEAKKAADSWEVPVGAVLVHHGRIIARGHNLVEELRDSTSHAEMICIREASHQLRTWRLSVLSPVF